jgi:hypothetical protein
VLYAKTEGMFLKEHLPTHDDYGKTILFGNGCSHSTGNLNSSIENIFLFCGLPIY